MLGHQSRLAVKVGIGEQPGRGTRIVENIEIVFTVVVAHPRAAADDLFEFHHRANHASKDDILARRNIDTSGEQLRSGQEHRSHGFEFLKLAEKPRPTLPSSEVIRQT